ncbi:hypothetical protein LTS18_010992 [Coniosporium uncinatum]|uniref:Uncharacterized protein n=1 Tax=Coniosporium uncinatum TaxID=93489 RepID=A0ACC3DL01_9PEZI|nr:hypothetical protein LTS18_010992 [Coniosporium uncinatum]
MSSILALVTLLASTVVAQGSSTVSMSAMSMSGVATNTAPVAGTPTSGASGGLMTVHVIKAGNQAGGLVFEPNSVTANVGDMVQFQFYPKNHSVAQSNFANPCMPIQMSDAAAAANAFYSGFMPTDRMGQLTYTIQVKDTNPIWFYCSQGKHCQNGMVGAINP